MGPVGLAALALAGLTSCGGGVGTVNTPTPIATPTPVPTPSPTPPPAPLATCATAPTGKEHWPVWNPGTTYAADVARGVKAYADGVHDWKFYQVPGGYIANGPYVTFASFAAIGADTRYDDGGVPQVLHAGAWVYNPVTIAQYILYHHTMYTRGVPLPSAFWAAIGKLQAMQRADGAYAYDYEFDGMKPGWTSAMAQGQVLSAMARAYLLSGDRSLIDTGNRSLEFMLKPAVEGGNRGDMRDLDPSLADYVALSEYEHSVSPHTLNGFLFTLFGLYDWAALAKERPGLGVKGDLAQAYFNCGVHTAASTLHYYDIGGFSVYDMRTVLKMGEAGVSPTYHKIHLAQITALYAMTGRPEFLQWAKVWAASVGQPIP